MLKECLDTAYPYSRHEINLAELVVRNRPSPLRRFDQIWMQQADLILQTKLIAPYLAGQEVIFMGDGDAMSLMLGLLAKEDIVPKPKHLRILDFDERILKSIERFAEEQNFGFPIETHRFNVFEAIPEHLRGQADWFYTNPPYGSKNEGLSNIVFLERCAELCKPRSLGCAILPYDGNRPWARIAMLRVQEWLHNAGYVVCDMVQQLHHYHLDDDPPLPSSTVIVSRVENKPTRWQGKAVPQEEVARFYGGNQIRIPQYISEDGVEIDWK